MEARLPHLPTSGHSSDPFAIHSFILFSSLLSLHSRVNLLPTNVLFILSSPASPL